jgi:CubicO group peptidase (beta-lactamase class C family)
MIDGRCDARFGAVREAFAENFEAHGEVGAACALVCDGELVVDLWGGTIDRDGDPWDADTMVETRSTTKGVTALCLHLLVDHGLVGLDEPVRRYWPDLRADPLVRHALSHERASPSSTPSCRPGPFWTGA